MGGKRKRKGGNSYSDSTPDFGYLASIYPNFKPYVSYSSRNGKPTIDWTDFNATRELTRVLLFHDHALNWWIPDGQLCPTVPNRLNYIHWIQHLLSSNLIPNASNDVAFKGFDIGTGANCIYPLLGASIYSWNFVASDFTDVAIHWATHNVHANPQVSHLIHIRPVHTKQDDYKNEPPILVGVVKDDEKFDFCMCNPPFFESMDEAGLNPKTSCGGTPEEMVCPGGERQFISRLIQDSLKLKNTFSWYTSLVGRKSNLSHLVSQLWKAGATIVKTTEFVQGKTSRWGLAWSFLPASKKMISTHAIKNNNQSFMLQGIQRQYSAFDVLQSVESFFIKRGASCKSNPTAFNIDITTSKDQLNSYLNTETRSDSESASADHTDRQSETMCFRISVFQQIPGTLLVKGTLKEREGPISGLFIQMFKQLEEFLENTFCTEKVSADQTFNIKR